jgi:hypothetical protein
LFILLLVLWFVHSAHSSLFSFMIQVEYPLHARDGRRLRDATLMLTTLCDIRCEPWRLRQPQFEVRSAAANGDAMGATAHALADADGLLRTEGEVFAASDSSTLDAPATLQSLGCLVFTKREMLLRKSEGQIDAATPFAVLAVRGADLARHVGAAYTGSVVDNNGGGGGDDEMVAQCEMSVYRPCNGDWDGPREWVSVYESRRSTVGRSPKFEPIVVDTTKLDANDGTRTLPLRITVWDRNTTGDDGGPALVGMAQTTLAQLLSRPQQLVTLTRR